MKLLYIVQVNEHNTRYAQADGVLHESDSMTRCVSQERQCNFQPILGPAIPYTRMPSHRIVKLLIWGGFIVDRTVEGGHLVGDARAAIDTGAVDVESFGEPLDIFPDLLDQLPRWCHYQSDRAIVLHPSPMAQVTDCPCKRRYPATHLCTKENALLISEGCL